VHRRRRRIHFRSSLRALLHFTSQSPYYNSVQSLFDSFQ